MTMTTRWRGSKGGRDGAEGRPGARGGEGGFALLFVIFTIMVVGILGALVLVYTSYALRNAVGVTPASRAQVAAESGLDIAHARLASEDPDLVNLATGQSHTLPTGSLWNGDGSYTVAVQKNPDMGDGDPYDWMITSSGTYTANVEGVERTFYRTLQEVITFAGGRYYSALNYVLFSKEGSININLDGNLTGLNISTCAINGDIYAGQNVTLADSAKLVGTNALAVRGDIITEKGDISLKNDLILFGGSKLSVEGNLYSGILAAPNSVGGGVDFQMRQGILNGNGTIELIGEVNSRGRLRDYDYGVRIDNFIGAVGTINTRIAGNIRSTRAVHGENRIWFLGTTNIQVEGTVHSGKDVTFTSSLPIAGAVMNNDINGSIYAGGDVNLYADGFLFGTMQNRVGGDIQAARDVNITHDFDAGCGSPSGYDVGGSIYGRNVTMNSRLGIGGTLSSRVGGNIYCGSLNLRNTANWLGTSRVTLSGSVYASGNATFDTNNGLLAGGPLTISGAVAALNPPNRKGVFSRGTLTMSADGSSDIAVAGDARDSRATWPLPANVTVSGLRTPAAPAFTPPAANPPTPPTSYNEVLLPKCDFDYYREMAKGQQASDGQVHYVANPGGGTYDLNIPAGMITTSLYVVFVEGDMSIGTVNVPINTTGVFVCTGNIYLRESMRKTGAGVAEFQLICNGKVTYSSSFTMGLEAEDRIFVYAGDAKYTPSDPVSVRYQMGWNRGVYGQITARGDIVFDSTASQFKAGIMNHSITYRSPAVLGEAFRIPFTVKSWKEL